MSSQKKEKQKQKSNSTILTFFQPRKSDINFGAKNDFIQNKLNQSKEQTVQCVEEDNVEIKRLKEELAHEKQKREKSEHDLKRAKQMLIEASRINLQKDVKICELNNTKNALNVTHSNNVSSVENSQNEFEEFSSNFTRDELKKLRSVNSGSGADYKFIRIILTSLYKDEKTLLQRTPTGKKYNNIIKKAITPPKKELINLMLRKRIEIEGAAEFDQRLSRLDYLIGQVIQNFKKKEKLKTCMRYIYNFLVLIEILITLNISYIFRDAID